MLKKLKKKKLHCELFTIGVEKIETNERYEDIKFEDIKLESLKMYHLECGSKITTSEIINGKLKSEFGKGKPEFLKDNYLAIYCERCKIRIWI